ncbi:hypothetical protein DEO72_LG2g3697 [Vigna unguiculata]|uniref:Uncharacterized protein n=1 Tax=Vigna unguiculata TaxID=3917 RepID=A0A4D6L4B3_VIGUN|nr:hypothetical protein DEO72_LG2g3697 [Vigna unguiculata]
MGSNNEGVNVREGGGIVGKGSDDVVGDEKVVGVSGESMEVKVGDGHDDVGVVSDETE